VRVQSVGVSGAVNRRVQVCLAAGGMSPIKCVFAVTKSAESAAHENVPSVVSTGLKSSG
jgi:hypothetical protein